MEKTNCYLFVFLPKKLLIVLEQFTYLHIILFLYFIKEKVLLITYLKVFEGRNTLFTYEKAFKKLFRKKIS